MSADQGDLFSGGGYKIAPAHYNTTRLAPAPLAKACSDARLQERAVLAILRGNARDADGQPLPMGPSAVWRVGIDTLGDTWLLTSVRRAMTNLTTAGTLQKLEQQSEGLYGRPEHVWRLTPSHPGATR